MTKPVVLLSRFAGMVSLLLLGGCAMVESSLIDDNLGAQCSSEAGFYYLPATRIQVSVTRGHARTAGAEKPIDTANDMTAWNQISVERIHVADRRRGYCLDYLARTNADDDIAIKKYKAQPLLGLVTSDSTDRSLEIAETVIRTIFTAVSGNPTYALSSTTQVRNYGTETGPEVKVFKGDYDPFDPMRSAMTNHVLREFGFCLVLEHYTFDLGKSQIDDYCDDPRRVIERAGQRKYDYAFGLGNQPQALPDERSDVDPTRVVRGLYYRPRIPYQLYLFTKKNLQARGGWQLASVHPVPMENIAPIMSIGVDRTAFAQRRTTLVFDEGMLRDACHFKGSELVEAVKLPLVVAQSVVALPANIVQVKIDQTNGMKELIAAQDSAIKTQAYYLTKLNPDAGSATAGTITDKKNIARPVTPYTLSAFEQTSKKSETDLLAVNENWTTTACKPDLSSTLGGKTLSASTAIQ